MHIHQITRYDAAEVQGILGDLATLAPRPEALAPQQVGAVMGYLPVEPELPHSQSLALVVWLPGYSQKRLTHLAQQELWYCNHYSRNLLKSHCFARLGGEHAGVYFDTATFFSLSYKAQSGHRMILVGDTDVLNVTHCYTGEAQDHLLCGLQGQGSCSGPNFSPERIYSEDELDACKDRGEEFDVSGVTAVLLQDEQLHRRDGC